MSYYRGLPGVGHHRHGSNKKFHRRTPSESSRRELTQAVWADIQLDTTSAQVQLLILPVVLDDVLLGLDFLVATGALLACGGAQLGSPLPSLNSSLPSDNLINRLVQAQSNDTKDKTRTRKPTTRLTESRSKTRMSNRAASGKYP